MVKEFGKRINQSYTGHSIRIALLFGLQAYWSFAVAISNAHLSRLVLQQYTDCPAVESPIEFCCWNSSVKGKNLGSERKFGKRIDQLYTVHSIRIALLFGLPAYWSFAAAISNAHLSRLVLQ